MAGAIRRARDAGPGRTLLFILTGGTPALFAYGTAMDEAMVETGAGR